MTGYTVHTGTTVKFSEGWDRIFSGAKTSNAKKKPGKQAAKPSSSKAKGLKSRKKS